MSYNAKAVLILKQGLHVEIFKNVHPCVTRFSSFYSSTETQAVCIAKKCKIPLTYFKIYTQLFHKVWQEGSMGWVV